VEEDMTHHDGSGNPTRVRSEGKGILDHDLYKKYCFLNIDIVNVDLTGEAVINLGASAAVVNGSNWLTMDCENVLFANFDVRFTCVGALTEFVNTTEGNVTSYRWNFGNQGTSTEENPTFIFSNARTYTVSLEVRGPGGVMVFEKRVTITPNTLAMPNIVINGAQLTSQAPASYFQWYRNGEKIDGATSRSYQVEDGGSYQVAVIDDQCNRISNTVVVSSLENEPHLGRLGYAIGPNPVDSKITVNINNAYLGPVSYELYSSSGVLVGQFERVKDRQEVFHQLEINQAKGLYLLMIRSGRDMVTYKLIKE
jgi:PKD repeat protein